MDEWIEERDMTVEEFARLCNKPDKEIQMFIAGERRVMLPFAKVLEIIFDTFHDLLLVRRKLREQNPCLFTEDRFICFYYTIEGNQKAMNTPKAEAA